MARTVIPKNDVTADQTDHADINNALAHAKSAYVIEGFEVTDAGGLDVDVAPGVATNRGQLWTSDATETLTLTDDDTNYVYLFGSFSFLVNSGVGSLQANASPGQIVLAEVVTSGGDITSITHFINNVSNGHAFQIKQSDTTKNSTTSLGDETDLRWDDYGDGQKWELEYRIIVNSGATPDFKFSLEADGSPDLLHWWVEGQNALNTSATTITTDGTDQLFVIRGLFVTGAAGGSNALDFRWAQNTSDAGDTILRAGSYMIARRLLA